MERTRGRSLLVAAIVPICLAAAGLAYGSFLLFQFAFPASEGRLYSLAFIYVSPMYLFPHPPAALVAVPLLWMGVGLCVSMIHRSGGQLGFAILMFMHYLGAGCVLGRALVGHAGEHLSGTISNALGLYVAGQLVLWSLCLFIFVQRRGRVTLKTMLLALTAFCISCSVLAQPLWVTSDFIVKSQ